MSYGLNLYKTDGTIGFSSDDVTWNQVDFFQVSGGGSASNDYPVLYGRDTLLVQMMINPPSTTQKSIAHTLSVAANLTTVNVSGGNQDVYVLVLMK